jgi:Kef-type K+ transport system membrane component KefB
LGFASLQLPLTSPGWIFAVLMAVVLFAPIAAERARIPGVVGLVVAGVLVGEHTTGLLQRDGAIALLGSVGLLYLMFVVGLELDLDDFLRDRSQALLFGGLTFAIPMVLGGLLIPLLGYSTLAAVLMASCWASHTLVAYPVYRRYGAVSSRAVRVSVGATIVTDTAALLVLAVVARAHTGGLDTTFWLTLVPGLAVLGGLVLVVLPRLARWFFGQLARDRSARFLFLLVALFVSAGLAELAGIEAIVGAFLAGLALNRVVAKGSVLAERVEFFGSTFLIPLFLVSVGMLVDPRVLADRQTLLISGAFTVLALGGKWLAAEAAGALLRYDRAEVGTMFALSGAQAAATLAAVIVGLQIGLIEEATVNAAIGVILMTCLLTAWVAARCAPRLRPPADRRVIGRIVVVPISRPGSVGPLTRLAGAIARRDGGVVVPLVVVPGSEEAPGLAQARGLASDAERTVLGRGDEAAAVVRIDDSAAAGAVHTLAEQGGTFLVLGWKGYSTRRESLFGGVVDAVVAAVDVPLAVARLADRPWRRIVVLVAAVNVSPAQRSTLELAMEVAGRLAAEGGLPVVVRSATDDPLVDVLAAVRLRVEVVHDPRRRTAMAADLVDADDIVILPLGPGGDLEGDAARVAQAVPRASVVAVLDSASRRVASIEEEPGGATLET